MKRLIALSVLGLLLSGCSVSHSLINRKHEIVCYDVTSKVTTYNIVTSGNVYAFVVQGHSVLAFYVDGDKQIQLISLVKNSCTIY